MRRHARIIRACLRNSVALDLEYRFDFVLNIATMALSLGAGALVLLVMFRHAGSLGGWTFHEALALYGVFLFFEELSFEVMTANIGRLPADIRDGHFDFVLLKPASSQRLVSVRRFPLTAIPSLAVAIGIVVWSMAGLGTLSPGNLALFLLLLLCGVVIMYAILALLLTTSFWLVRVENITEVFHALFAAGRFPVSAFPRWMRMVFTAIVPVAFITTVPASAAIGRIDSNLALAAPFVAGALLWLSGRLWKLALSHYTSASS
jgi:ABC-2 type transport system permease protein